jgi:L-rhamnose-H+ transport protein
MQVILGVIFHFIGGAASGSFYIPFKKVKGWSWESYWIIGGLFSWLIVPPLAAYLTIPAFAEILSNIRFLLSIRLPLAPRILRSVSSNRKDQLYRHA